MCGKKRTRFKKAESPKFFNFYPYGTRHFPDFFFALFPLAAVVGDEQQRRRAGISDKSAGNDEKSLFIIYIL